MSNAAFINALMEEGTKQDCLEQVVRLWNEKCELAKQLADARNQLVSEQWQPIETAPKDTGVLVVHDGSWVSEAYYSIQSNGWWLANTNEHDFEPARPIYPTHWMPLPAAPTSALSDEQGAK